MPIDVETDLRKTSRPIEAIYIHCSATKPGVHLRIEAIRKWHVEGRGFRDIGYHYIVQPDGTVYPGRDIDQDGAHVKGDNTNTIGICMVGEWNGETHPARLDPQIWATGDLAARLCHMYEIKPDSYGLLLHREAHLYRMAPNPRKSCPGMNIEGRAMRLYVKWHYDRLCREEAHDERD